MHDARCKMQRRARQPQPGGWCAVCSSCAAGSCADTQRLSAGEDSRAGCNSEARVVRVRVPPSVAPTTASPLLRTAPYRIRAVPGDPRRAAGPESTSSQMRADVVERRWLLRGRGRYGLHDMYRGTVSRTPQTPRQSSSPGPRDTLRPRRTGRR
ncbi:hypothetical protein BDV95DRAFT_122861 [Massariosphaeria phaeospora]|uniref:Uncharacterized protein n=1 Tax=Massariosphaeria phaeospora TaxID=100035 RepID=A0A7C8I3Z7_9PLEO|nr:hypothetical protein BDV95DRAFT_122861 [Massariosphaeria phaeospora]